MVFLPYLVSSIFGWIMARLFVMCERNDSFLRLMNYPIGIAGAALGTKVSQLSPHLYNKFFVLGIICSGIMLLLYQSLRRLLTRHNYQASH